MIFGMWHNFTSKHRTHKVNKKKLQHSRLQSGREIYKKLSKSGGLVWLGDFAMFFANFSARLQSWVLEFFWFTLCVLCGHFEYNKPTFFDNAIFLIKSRGSGLHHDFILLQCVFGKTYLGWVLDPMNFNFVHIHFDSTQKMFNFVRKIIKTC